MSFDHDRLEGLRQGAYGAPEHTNIAMTVADLRWLTDELTLRVPPRPEPVTAAEAVVEVPPTPALDPAEPPDVEPLVNESE